MSDFFVDQTSAVLAKVLDGVSARQRVLADNIANAETPGYVRQELTFEDTLHAAMETPTLRPETRIAAIANVSLATTHDTLTPAREDGNNVQIEREMTDMAKNSLEYETTVQLLEMKLRGLHDAIFEGKR